MVYILPNTTACLTALALAVGLAPLSGFAQESDAPEFEIENAVLDTSILFVTGAQEAVQELRGAFGWPTFQEGLTDGIYYRFDPDGYARFAPTARLDTDVFEVTCRSRTVTCQAQKGILRLNPTSTGQFQLVIEDFVEGEQFFLIEGTTEIQLPAQILEPLDARLETLLSSNGELVVRRGADERARVALTGFGQTVAYLRWVAARQDYGVLPSGWPVPNGVSVAPSRLTATDVWSNPMANGLAPPEPAAEAAPVASNEAEIESLRREMEMLRSLVAQSGSAPPVIDAPLPQPVAALPVTSELSVSSTSPTDAKRLADLEAVVASLSAKLANGMACGENNALPCPPAELAESETSDIVPVAEVSPSEADSANQQRAKQVEYLMTEIGLDAETALVVLELGTHAPDAMRSVSSECSASVLNLAFSDEMTRQALADLAMPLSGDTSGVAHATEGTATKPGPADNSGVQDTEYLFLSEYLRSVHGQLDQR